MSETTPNKIKQPTRPIALLVLTGFLALNFLVMFLGGLLTRVSVGGWYQTIERPAWNPPGYVFGIVWPLLYLLIALAMWRLWLSRPVHETRLAFGLLGVQLLLNIAWSGTFFTLQHIGYGFFVLLPIVLLIYPTLFLIWRHDRAAALLLVPYTGWVTFAAILNFTLWRLNGWVM